MSILSSRTDIVRPPQPRAGDSPWQQKMKDAIRQIGELCRVLDIPRDSVTSRSRGRLTAADEFSLFVPRGFAGRMKRGDPLDPLLLQVLPTAAELEVRPGFHRDPVSDQEATLAPGMLQKYTGRALLITTGACAVHCRYCFRRHFPYATGPRTMEDWQPALDALAIDRSIHEVILSGGDPLTLVDPLLARLAERLAQIPHLRRLRIHTRLPIMIPERVTDALLGWLTGTRLSPIVVVHVNHAQELDWAVGNAVRRIIDAGVPVLNQSVLLAGVNDSATAQLELCERLVDLGVMPYYLHLLDPVQGAAHFDVPEAQGLAIIERLRVKLPGYAVPRLVREVPGAGSKIVLA